MTTKEYIQQHKNRVKRWTVHFCSILFKRSYEHDTSKLEEPEYSAWCKMDEEPRYPYGSKEYKDKLKRFAWVFKMHYQANRHHPEYFDENDFQDRDLIDLIEMLADWISYKESITYTEASDLIHQQCERFNFSEELEDLLLNTLKNHFVDFGGLKPPKPKLNKQLVDMYI